MLSQFTVPSFVTKNLHDRKVVSKHCGPSVYKATIPRKLGVSYYLESQATMHSKRPLEVKLYTEGCQKTKYNLVFLDV
jgi:hypothetical protein